MGASPRWAARRSHRVDPARLPATPVNRIRSAALVIALMAGAAPIASNSSVAARARGTVLALDLLGFVPVEREHRGGYHRELFDYPQQMGGGCDTRDRVLEQESAVRVRFTT